MYHEYDLNLAKEDLAIYRPSETGIDSWDADDRIIFETAYRLHAKSFLKIQGIVLTRPRTVAIRASLHYTDGLKLLR